MPHAVQEISFIPFGAGLPTSGQWREGFAIADMNGDGHLDIVHGPPRKHPGGPVILLGDGKGTWKPWREAQYPPLPYDYGDIQLADFDGDGHADLALAVHERGLLVLRGDGHGSFSDASKGLDFSAAHDGPGFSSRGLRVVDWDGDGRPDLVAVSEGPRPVAAVHGSFGSAGDAYGVAVYLNDREGGWRRERTMSRGIFSDSIALGDFEGDGRKDVATGSSVMGRTDLVNMWPAGGASRPVSLDLRPQSFIEAVTAADFDGDGRDDLAVSYLSFEGSAWHSGIDLFYSRGAGRWERRTLVRQPGKEGAVALGSGHLTRRPGRDIVALTSLGDTWVFLPDGKGGFALNGQPIPRFGGGCRGSHVELADLDGDGRDEIVASFADEGTNCPSGGGITAWKVAKQTGHAR